MASSSSDDSQKWGQNSATYAAVGVLITEPIEQAALERHASHWEKVSGGSEGVAMRFLDVAAGPGHFSRILAERLRAEGKTFSVVCTDLAEGMVEAAAKANQDPDVRCVKMDGQDMSSIPDASIDGLTCLFGIMYMPEHQRCIQEMKRVLKPGALATVATWKDPAIITIADNFGVFLGNKDPQVTSFGTKHNQLGKEPEDLAALFKKAGFSEVEVVQVPNDAILPNLEMLYKTLVENPVLSQSVMANKPGGAIEPTFDLFLKFLEESPLSEPFRRADGRPGCQLKHLCNLAFAVC